MANVITITTANPAIIDQFLIKLDIDFTVTSGVLNAVVDKIQAARLYQTANTDAAKSLIVQCILNAVDGTNPQPGGNVVPVRVTTSGQIPVDQYWSSMAADDLVLILPPLISLSFDGATYYLKAMNFNGCKVLPNGNDYIDDLPNQVISFGDTQNIQFKADLKNKTWLVF